MSAFGPKRTSPYVAFDVAIGGKADMCSAKGHVRFTPDTGHWSPSYFPIIQFQNRRCGSPGQCLSSSRRDATGVPPFPIAKNPALSVLDVLPCAQLTGATANKSRAKSWPLCLRIMQFQKK